MNIRVRLLFLVSAFFILFFPACKKADVTDNNAVVSRTLLNVAYGTGALQNMDIYLPPNRSNTNTKLMILIHGGSWTGGDKNDFNAYVDTMKRRLPNYAIANINYSLVTGNTNLFPTQENDVRSAIEYLYTNRNDLIFSDQFVLVGASAGAHLALLQGYKYNLPVRPKAIVDFFGPADMRAMYLNPTIPGGEIPIYNVFGKTPFEDSLSYAHSSPINFVSATAPPTIILHGGVDIVVRPSQSDSLYNRLQSAGVASRYIVYPTENHGWTGNNLFDSFNQIESFLQQYVP